LLDKLVIEIEDAMVCIFSDLYIIKVVADKEAENDFYSCDLVEYGCVFVLGLNDDGFDKLFDCISHEVAILAKMAVEDKTENHTYLYIASMGYIDISVAISRI
jgi:hypothetical protein